MKTKFFVPLTMVIAVLLAGCGSGDSTTPPASTNTTANSSSPVVQPEVYAQKKVDVAALNQALQQYDAAEGHFPTDLKELAPNYIGKVPEAPAGYKFEYDQTRGVVTLAQQQ
jgi:hypothetical protein